MATRIKRIEFFDPENNAVVLAVTNPKWISFLMEESEIFRSYGENISPNTTVFRWPTRYVDPNYIKILSYMVHNVPPTIPVNQYNQPFENRTNEYTFGNNIFTRAEIEKVFDWLMLPHEGVAEYLNAYLGSAIPKPNVENSINRAVKARKELLYQFEPGLNGKTPAQRNYNQMIAVIEAERQRILERHRQGQGRTRRYRTRRRGRFGNESPNYNSNNSNNNLQRELNELNERIEGPPELLEEAYRNLQLPPRTMNMSNVEFERWLREHPQTRVMRGEQYASSTVPNYNLHKLFNKNGGRRGRKSRRAAR